MVFQYQQPELPKNVGFYTDQQTAVTPDNLTAKFQQG